MALPSLSGLTTGQIAALIALGIFLVQIFFSFAFSLVLVALLQERETAVTWSVVSRILHRSYWPTLLRTDAVASRGVRRPINLISWAILLTTVLVAVAAIITPLGLYDAIDLSDSPVLVPFKYLSDPSPFGNGTLPPPTSGPSRFCVEGDLVCPNSANKDYIITYRNGTLTDGTRIPVRKDNLTSYDIRIPRKYVEFLGSGTARLGRGVSSPFDIQYRTWEEEKPLNGYRQGKLNGGKPYPRGDYRPLDTVLLNDAWDIVEGLIVDTKTGGVGFRNHTAPAEDLPLGATWTEDILFIEPVTECVDIGITLNFNYSTGINTGTSNLTMVDQGGFVNINRTAPRMGDVDFQQDPRLAERAYAAGWSWKFLQMLIYNITDRRDQPSDDAEAEPLFTYLDSSVGKGVKLPTRLDGLAFWPVPDKVSMTNFDSNIVLYIPGIKTGNFTAPTSNSPNNTLNFPPNPFGVVGTDFESIDAFCSRTGINNTASPRNVVAKCGLFYGMPQKKPGIGYSVPISSCASANRVIIKTVRFSFNTSDTVSGLKIESIEPKKYASSSEYPLWAFESSDEAEGDPQWNIRSWDPLWGIVEKEDSTFSNLTYKRSPELWLTGNTATNNADYSGFNLAAITIPRSLLYHGYEVHQPSGSLTSSRNDLADYSGKLNIEMLNLWRNLSATPQGTGRMIDLVWTDVAANAFYGGRGMLPVGLPPNLARRDDGETAESEMVPVFVRKRWTRYRYVYAIPAFIVLAIVAATLVGSIVAAILGRGTIGRIKMFLARLSAGRVMTAILVKDEPVTEGEGSMAESVSTSRWLEKDGRVMVDVSRRRPHSVGLDYEKGEGTSAVQSGK